MSRAVFRTMLLGLARDRGALAMSFALPAVFFLIFAAIFSGATGEQLRLKVALCDEVSTPDSRRMLDVLRADPALIPLDMGDSSASRVRELVRAGTADVGLIVRAGAEPLGSMGGFGDAPLVIVSDPARGVAVPMLKGLVQKAYFTALPDVALGGVVDVLENDFLELTPEQKSELQRGLAGLREEADTGSSVAAAGVADMFEREDVVGQTAAKNHVAYYAGAVAVLFLLFSAVHGAISLLEERESGVLERVLAGPGSSDVLVTGKFLFLVVQGFVQVGVIFVIAWLVHGVDLPAHWMAWGITTLAASVAAAGLSLTVAAASATRRQAQTLSNVAILVLSALGGSMVPRFLMPAWLQDLGWITPNTWALEAYTSIFWRGQPVSALWLPWLVLILAGLAGLGLARALARRFETL